MSRLRFAAGCLLGVAGLRPGAAAADGFSSKMAPTLTGAQVANMECRYFTELLGVHSKAQIEKQLAPIANTDVDTVVCCPMSWRFYNFPSGVDLTWKEPERFHRDLAAFPNWRRMVDNLQAGGDPLKDALESVRRLHKAFVVSFRMNDNHYVNEESFPTHDNFWRGHPEFRLGQANARLGDTAPLFDYMFPPVRNFYFSVLKELCENYEVDGVELDFERAPRFFHDRDLGRGRAVMTEHMGRIRAMLDQVGAKRGKHLSLSVRVMQTVEQNLQIGADVMAWDAAGWLDGIVVSPSYIHTVDTGIEGFVARRKHARIYGELNFVHVQLAGTGHNAQERRYLTAETYRAATLSFLERGADGVSFFNTYCIPQPELGKLTSTLLTRFKSLEVLRDSDQDYTSYATPSTMFGRVFPAKNQKSFQMFVAIELPGRCRKAVLRFETKQSCAGLQINAWVNGFKLEPFATSQAELFPPLTLNRAGPHLSQVKFFAVPLSALHFGANQIAVNNAGGEARPCDFMSAELALYTHAQN
jgi:hypothetical protein